ncbi:MAG: PfkB family carbohydrate kinase [Chloroflexota bacterium]
MKIISVGEITYDDYLRQNLFFVGGISLNFAVHAKRSGAEQVSLVSCVGTDEAGQVVLAALAREGVDHSHVTVLEGKTAVCAIDVHDNADRFFPPHGYHLNVLTQLKELPEETIAFVRQHDIIMSLYQGAWSAPFLNQLLALPNFAGKRAVDFGDWSSGRSKEGAFDALRRVDLAFISGDEETVHRMRPLAAAVDGLVVVTLGAAGSVALTKEGEVWQTAVSVSNPVDSTGCGDSFQATFAINYFRDGDVANALHKGAERAAGVLQHYGAFG